MAVIEVHFVSLVAGLVLGGVMVGLWMLAFGGKDDDTPNDSEGE